MIEEIRRRRSFYVRHVCQSVRPSVWNSSPTSGRILWDLIHELIFRNSINKMHVSLKYDKNNGTVHEDQYTFMIKTRW